MTPQDMPIVIIIHTPGENIILIRETGIGDLPILYAILSGSSMLWKIGWTKSLEPKFRLSISL